MGQFFQINGDYNIKTKDGGRIILSPDPDDIGVDGTPKGKVIVQGDLQVLGSNTSVESTDLDITDRIVTLNKGEETAEVSLRYSGLEIDRGTSSRSALVFDDSRDAWIIGYRTGNDSDPATTYGFNNSKLLVENIITNDTDLTLIGSSGTDKVVKITGATDYTNQIITRSDDNILTNKGYVDYAILNNPTFQIVRNNSRVIVTDVTLLSGGTDTDSIDYLYDTTFYTTDESVISMVVDEQFSAQFFYNRAKIQELEFFENKILLPDTSRNLIIETNGSGKIQLNCAFQIEQISSNVVGDPSHPVPIPNNTFFYAGLTGTGQTGLYFSSESAQDELISKRKAFLLSMLF